MEITHHSQRRSFITLLVGRFRIFKSLHGLRVGPRRLLVEFRPLLGQGERTGGGIGIEFRPGRKPVLIGNNFMVCRIRIQHLLLAISLGKQMAQKGPSSFLVL